jgi:Cu2+-containing amine oxidase
MIPQTSCRAVFSDIPALSLMLMNKRMHIISISNQNANYFSVWVWIFHFNGNMQCFKTKIMVISNTDLMLIKMS